MMTIIIMVLMGAFLAFLAPPFVPERFLGFAYGAGRFQGRITTTAMRAAGVAFIVLGIASTSYIHVSDGHFAQVFKIYGGSSLTGGRIVATNGETGPQGYIIRPGFHPQFLINVINSVDTSKKEHVVPKGEVGVLIAKDGTSLRPGQAFADPFHEKFGYQMLDVETFFKNGGQRGPQLTVLAPGSYPLNDYLWKVENKPAYDVNTGFVGVVKSNVWAEIDFGTLKASKPEKCDVILAKDKTEGRLEAPIVPVGCVGVWKDALAPGKYYMNPDAFSIIPIDTRAQVWTYAGGYQRCEISLTVDSKGEIVQKRECAAVPVEKDNADRAVFVKMEGWDVPLELRVVAQVSPAEASCVVAGVGTLKEVEDRVLTPSIRAIVRDVSGGTYDVEETKVDENGKPILDKDGKPIIQKVKRPTKVLDLINQRPLIESEVERRIRPEGEKSCVTIREVRLGEPAIPPELLVAVRREQLATQLAKAYIQEQGAQTKRIDSEKAKATADQQSSLVTAEIEVQRTEQTKRARLNEGQGERDKLQAIAVGQKAQLDVLGQEATVGLRKFELTLATIGDFFTKNPDVLRVALENAHKFVPNVQVGSTGDSGVGGIFGALLGQQLSNGVPSPAPSTRIVPPITVAR